VTCVFANSNITSSLAACHASMPRTISVISPSKFDEMRKDGRVGPARMIDDRKVWDVRDLDLAFEALPLESNEETEDWNAAV
jgi:hypothetical protein